MKKISTIKFIKTISIALIGSIASMQAVKAQSFSEEFEDITTLAAGGWEMINMSNPVGSTGWFQGNPQVFASYSMAGYIGANYNNTGDGTQSSTDVGTISNWLLSPTLTLDNGDSISFYVRTVDSAAINYPDRMQLLLSTNGSSNNVGADEFSVGDFTTTLLDINPTYSTSGYPIGFPYVWTQLTAVISGLSGPTSGRFAFRYFVENAGFSGTNSDYIGIDLLNVYAPIAGVDGGVSALTAIPGDCAGLSATTPITVTINNYSATNALTGFDVSYSINGGTPVTETYTGTIAASSNASYTFTATADLSAPGNYVVDAYTSITGDVNAGNDHSSLTTFSGGTSITIATPFTEGFESTAVGIIPPSGWTTEDTDGDGNSWDFTNAYPHSGTMCSRVPFPTGGPAENWLFTPCLSLTAGTSYQLELWYKSFDASMTSFEVEPNFGTAANSASMSFNIAASEPLFPDSSYHMAQHLFAAPSSGTYYIGFKGFSLAASASLRMDDAAINVITGINEIDHANDLQISPNPTNGVLNITGRIMDKNLTLVITNSLGQSVYSAKYKEAFKVQVDLSAFASGVYTVQLISSKAAITKKIVLEN